jgi:hypothetical protein
MISHEGKNWVEEKDNSKISTKSKLIEKFYHAYSPTLWNNDEQ